MPRLLWTPAFVFCLSFFVSASPGRADDAGIAEPGAMRPTVSLDSLGKVHVGGALPWFAADTVPGRILNRTKALGYARADTLQGIAFVFFATWCRACRPGLNALGKNRRHLDSAGVRVYLIDYKEDGAGAPAFLDNLGARQFTVLPDRFGVIAENFGVIRSDEKGGLPKTFVSNADGRLCAIFSSEGPDYIDRVSEACPHAK